MRIAYNIRIYIKDTGERTSPPCPVAASDAKVGRESCTAERPAKLALFSLLTKNRRR